MRFHHQFTVARLSVALGLVLAALPAGAQGQGRSPIRDPQVMHASGADEAQAVEYGYYQTDGQDAADAIRPISGELAEAAYPESYPEGYPPGMVDESGAYGPMDPNLEMGMAPPGETPPGMQPWPGISPFDHRFSEHYNDNGLWMHNTNDSQRKWNGGIEFLWVGLQKINSDQQRIGYPIYRSSFTQRLHRDLSVFKDNMSAAGVRPYLMFTDPDDSGAEVSGFWTGSPDESHLFTPQGLFPGADNRIAGTQAIPGLLPIEIARINQETGVEGTPIFYNQALLAEYGAQAWGADATLITTPFLGRGANKVRMTYGMRYLDVRENLALVGFDTINGRSRIESIVRSRLFGPQIGARWDLGGENLKLITQGKAGVMANFEKLVVNADNYGFGANSRIARESEENRHLSPLLEFSFTAEMPLFRHIPVLKRTPIVKDGIFRVGYTYTAVYMMQRPAGIVTYADPLPRIDSDPTKWSVQWVNFGIDWKW